MITTILSGIVTSGNAAFSSKKQRLKISSREWTEEDLGGLKIMKKANAFYGSTM